MKLSSFVRACSAGAVATLLMVSGVGAAQAIPHTLTPAEGPDSGNTTVTVQLPMGPTWTKLEPGRFHVLGLASNGLLYTWDVDSEGSITQVPTPAGVTFTDISVGTTGNLALATDGTVYTWGGFAADGSGNFATTPTLVPLPAGLTAVQVSMGRNYALVLTSAGTVYGWGGNSEGTLGIGALPSQYTPTLVQTDPTLRVTQISAGAEHVLAVAVAADDTAKVLGWGNNSTYALTTQPNNARNERTPIEITMPVMADVTAETLVSASMGDGSGSSHIITSGGVSWGMGRNTSGETGIGYTNTEVRDVGFTQPAGGQQVRLTELDAGNEFVAAIDTTGALYSWGATPATLLNGATAPTHRLTPAETPAEVTLSEVKTGVSTITALGDDGNAYIWGTNPGVDTLGTPRVLPAPPVTLTGATFGGSEGTAPTHVGGSTWTIVTPQHTTGTFDVTVDWAIGGVAQTPLTYTDGFSFTGQPTVAALTNQTTQVGVPATFALSTRGFPAPEITWEVSFLTGNTPAQRSTPVWQPISADASAVVSDEGQTLTVTPGLGYPGALYRATATNEHGSMTTNAASLTIASAGGGDADGGDADGGDADGGDADGGDADGGSDGSGGSGGSDASGGSGGSDNGTNGSGSNSSGSNSNPSLATTGGTSPLVIAGAAGVLLLTAGGVLTARAARRERTE